ncbi:fibronectin type III domain-containing protein [Candidatus Gottesmanbacteria bacterium]|nr:fibronectin type III domain-containing protein [Candidatus Gottesmanbacteria bacterium]
MNIPTKFPTIFGLILLIAFIGSIIFGFERISRITTNAAPTVAPTNVIVTNITDTSFTVTWTTHDDASGAITIVTEHEKNQVLYDERDTQGSIGKYVTHSIVVRNAKPSSRYQVTILSNGKTYLNQGSPWVVQTGTQLTSLPNNLEPAFGTVLSDNDEPATGAIVYLSLEGSQILSSLVSSSGSWIIALNTIRKETLESFIEPEQRLTEVITIRSGTNESYATTDTLNDAPVPAIRLGKSYDFRKIQVKNTKSQEKQSNTSFVDLATIPNVLGSQTIEKPTPQQIFSLISPAQDASLSTFVPNISGTGIPGKRVAVTLGIKKPFGASVVVGSDGSWRYTPSEKLTSGKQSVTVTSVDANGKPKAITHTFEVLKSGTQVLGEATPSATLTPEATPTDTLSGQPLPTSGSILPTLLLLVLGVSLISSGAIIFVK